MSNINTEPLFRVGDRVASIKPGYRHSGTITKRVKSVRPDEFVYAVYFPDRGATAIMPQGDLVPDEQRAPRYVPGKMGVDSKCADLAEALLADQKAAKDSDVTALAEAFQRAFEEADEEIENRA